MKPDKIRIDHSKIKNELGLKYGAVFRDARKYGFRIKLWDMVVGYFLDEICNSYQNALPGFSVKAEVVHDASFGSTGRCVMIYCTKHLG